MLYDVVVIGGGINGCGCAADAASRGLSVLLCEKEDLASQTSSASSKLIHGGLRYLENFDLKLVKKSLLEQKILLNVAPHIIKPLEFVIPNAKKNRSNFKIKIGLFLYDYLRGDSVLPKSITTNYKDNPIYFNKLSSPIKTAYNYYDATADDARLTIINAIQAHKNNAEILTRTELIKAKVIDNIWYLTLRSKNNEIIDVKAKAVINAAGPWVKTVDEILKVDLKQDISLVSGSHIVVKKLYHGEHAYLLQNNDGRIIFTIPYNGYSMIGTTETLYDRPMSNIKITKPEIDYMCKIIKRYFNKDILEGDILYSWSGMRTLINENKKNISKITRDYFLSLTNTKATAISIYGGKITTYRQLATEAIDKLKLIFPNMKSSITNITPLPGSIFNDLDFNQYLRFARAKYRWLPKHLFCHYMSNYGSLTEILLKDKHKVDDLGVFFGKTLTECEVKYLISSEFAMNEVDILWRRTKLGLNINKEATNKLRNYLGAV